MHTNGETDKLRPGAGALLMLWLALAGFGGCSSGAAAEMQLLRVTPERIPLGSETVLTVTGNHIRTSIRIDLDSSRPPETGHFVAWVGDLGPLTGVSVLDTENLKIVVPGALGLGLHGVTVRDTLAGADARLANAVEVFDAQGAVGDAGDVAPPPALDAAVVSATDASVDVTDAGVAPTKPDANASCSGAPYGGVCWYLGDAGATCEQTCQPHGGYTPEALAFVGTADQGGNSAQCAEILGLLGHGQSVIEASRNDVGLGCHLWGVEEQGFWLTAPDFAPTAGSGAARVVCGCNS